MAECANTGGPVSVVTGLECDGDAIWVTLDNGIMLLCECPDVVIELGIRGTYVEHLHPSGNRAFVPFDQKLPALTDRPFVRGRSPSSAGSPREATPGDGPTVHHPVSGGTTVEGVGPDAPVICEKLESIKQMLLEKNRLYGGSALAPLRVFSRASPEEQLLARIDDKLSRLHRGAGTGPDEDTIMDLVGYLVLLLISRDGGSQ